MAPSEHTKNPERVAAGLKASIKNPNVSEEAKVHASERLQELSSEKPQQQQAKASHHRAEPEHGVNIESSRVLGGYKATLHNEHTSEEAKNHAREILAAAGYHEFSNDEKEHQMHVLAGYKAALHNPRVSEEAKAHAREYIKLHDTK